MEIECVYNSNNKKNSEISLSTHTNKQQKHTHTISISNYIRKNHKRNNNEKQKR